MRKILLFSILFLSGSAIFAQQQDFGLWTTLDIEKNLTKNLEVEFGFTNRLKDNLNQRDETMADIGISYKYQLFIAGFSYRFTNNNFQPDVVYSHRFAWQFRLRPEWNRITFDWRTRFQSQYFGINSSETGTIPENFLRNRIKVDYNIRKSPLDPFASYESFYRIRNDKVSEFQRNRFSVGLGYKINQNNEIGLSYIFHQTFNVNNPKNLHIISLGYSLDV